MKKIVSLLLILVLLFAVTSCGNEKAKETSEDKVATENKEEVTEGQEGTISLDIESIRTIGKMESPFFDLDDTLIKGQTKENVTTFTMVQFFESIGAETDDDDGYYIPVFLYNQKVSKTHGIYVIDKQSSELIKDGLMPEKVKAWFVYETNEDKLVKFAVEVDYSASSNKNMFAYVQLDEQYKKDPLLKSGEEYLLLVGICNK